MHAQGNDEPGIDQPDQHPERQHGHHHRDDAVGIVVDQPRCQARGQADQRSDRKVDSSAEDRQGLAHADQGKIGGLLEDIEEVAKAQEAVRYRGTDKIDGTDQAKHAREPRMIAELPRHRTAGNNCFAHAARSLVARCMMLSSVASPARSSPVTRPSRMTITRSAMPMTSVSSELIIRIATPDAASSRMMR